MTQPPDSRANLREPNQLRILDVLRERGATSRSEIAQLAGLSRTAVHTNMAALKSRGLVADSSSDSPDRASGTGRGRRPRGLRLEPSAGAALGIVFEESRVRVAVADLAYAFYAERSAEVRLHDVPGREGASPDEALDVAFALANEVLAEAGIDRDRVVGVGLGIPAPLDQKTGIVASDTILHRWKDVRAADQLAERLKLPVEIDNDANLGALGELLFGAGRGIDDFIYVKHSPYVGSALVIDGKLRRGATGIAGELGHIQVQPGGAICGGCGKRGCLGPIVAAAVLARLLEPSHGAGITLPQMRLLIERGDVVASRIANDAGRTIGKVLAGYCNQLNPAAIIVQGELSVSGGPLLGGIREEIDRGAIPAAAAAVTVKPTELGDRAELLGAAALVIANPERVPSSAFLRLG